MATAMQRARDFIRRRNDRAKNTILALRMSAETFAAGSGAAYARGRFGDEAMRFGGVDAELGGGLLALGVGVTGVLGRSVSPDAIAIGTGLLTNYGVLRFLQMGEEHREQDIATEGRRRRATGGAMGPGTVSPIGSGRVRVPA